MFGDLTRGTVSKQASRLSRFLSRIGSGRNCGMRGILLPCSAGNLIEKLRRYPALSIVNNLKAKFIRLAY